MSRRNKPIQRAQRPTSSAASRIYSRENVGRYAERARQRRRGKIVRRSLLGVFLGVLVVGVAAAGLWFSSIVHRLNNGEVITNDLLMTLVDSDVTRDPFYMLLLGTDGRPGEEAYRADTIILARVDPNNKHVTLISIPRDTKVEYNGSTMKINGVHTYGGPDDMVRAVNELCGVEISHYAEISFDGLVALTDAVGGVEVDVPDRIDDPKAGDFVIEPGLQTLNGEQALAFCRSRAYADGDYTRMRHQRIFIAALANTLLNKVDAGNIVPIIDSVSDMVVTDLSIQDIVSLANAMRGMKGFQNECAAFDRGRDVILRHAPCVIFAHAKNETDGLCFSDCAVALTYLEFMLYTLGLGTTWAGYVVETAQKTPAIRDYLGLPEGHNIFAGCMAGYPSVKYLRIPERKPAVVAWI